MKVTHSLLAAVVAAAPVAANEEADRHFPSERLEPAVDREGIINTSWASVPKHLDWDVALWFAYSNNPLFTYGATIPGTPNERQFHLVDDRLTAHLTGAIALFDWFELGAELPVVLQQTRDETLAPPGEAALAANGIGDVRLYPKMRLIQQRDGAPLDIGFQMPVTLPTGQYGDYLGEHGYTLTPTVLASHEWKVADGAVRAAANVGLRMRSETVTLADDENSVGTELLMRAGAAYAFEAVPELRTELSLAVAGAEQIAGFIDGLPAANPVEVLGELEQGVWGPLSAFIGGATGVVAGNGGPDFRLFAGLRFAPRAPLDDDGDGVLNDDDKCRTKPETVNGFEDADGCPDTDDKDSDGVKDSADKCPDQPEDKDGFQDDDGCIDDDHDADGLKNDADKCADQPEDKDGFQDDDGCPDADNDGDGFDDASDRCKDSPEDKDGVQDDDGCPEDDADDDKVADAQDRCPVIAGTAGNKGCPDADRDGDSVVDRLDNCPDEKGSAENAGCATKQRVVLTAGKLEILDKVFFKTGKDQIEKKSFALLDNVAAVVAAHAELKKIRVEGHSDNKGDPKKNRDLSDRRAKAVVAYLVSKGVSAERLEGLGFGDEKPIADNATDDGRAANRRVEFVIVGD